jgi:hypothetical protein
MLMELIKIDFKVLFESEKMRREKFIKKQKVLSKKAYLYLIYMLLENGFKKRWFEKIDEKEEEVLEDVYKKLKNAYKMNVFTEKKARILAKTIFNKVCKVEHLDMTDFILGLVYFYKKVEEKENFINNKHKVLLEKKIKYMANFEMNAINNIVMENLHIR